MTREPPKRREGDGRGSSVSLSRQRGEKVNLDPQGGKERDRMQLKEEKGEKNQRRYYSKGKNMV